MKRLAIVLMSALVLAASVQAATPPLGLRAGYTSWEGLNQFHFGAHARMGDLFPNVAFTPNLEIGTGDNLTVIAVNGDLAYRVTELSSAPWGPYVGGSLGLIYAKPHGFDGNADLGLSALVGTSYAMDNGHELLLEVRLGILDSPGFKATIGYTFF